MSSAPPWKEKIVGVLAGRDMKRLWFTHGMIRNGVLDEYPNHRRIPSSISVYLTNLIRTGHVERAIKPHHMFTDGRITQREYLYRWTGKAYDDKPYYGPFVNSDTLIQGRDIFLDNRTLPKWFRSMMMD